MVESRAILINLFRLVRGGRLSSFFFWRARNYVYSRRHLMSDEVDVRTSGNEAQ